ncbi:MAG: FUSC family protein, partial [Myxococcales bacterium]
LEAILRLQPPAAVVAARRRIGLATANAEAALQRLIGEAPPARRVQPLMTLVAYARRLSASITALGSALPDPTDAAPLDEALRTLADAAEAGRSPPPLPALDEKSAPEPAQRLARQLRVVHSALARLS